MRAVRARILALFAALVLLLPGGAFARTQYYCAVMGRVVASCCCETEAVTQAPSAVQELEVGDCCQRLSAANRSASLGTRDVLHGVAAAAVLPTVTEPVRAAALGNTASPCTAATEAPLAIGPPLFVIHCALLS
ncbi:MAG TPA: hypothetical protein VIK01_09205 [Polyangiaceae bacterium]